MYIGSYKLTGFIFYLTDLFKFKHFYIYVDCVVWLMRTNNFKTGQPTASYKALNFQIILMAVTLELLISLILGSAMMVSQHC